MKLCWVLTLILWAHASLAQQPPALTGEQILDKNLEARGGRGAWEQVKTFSLEANFTGPAPSILPLSVVTPIPRGNGGTIRIAYAAPDRIQTLTSVAGIGDFFYACNGTVQWWNRADGSLKVERPTGFSCKAPSLPKSWGEEFKKVELTGVKNINGRPAYRVRLTPKKGAPRTDYFDQENFLRVRSEMIIATPAYRAITVIEDYSDYRDVNGVRIAFVTKRRMSTGTGNDESITTVTRIAINSQIPESTFAVPQ